MLAQSEPMGSWPDAARRVSQTQIAIGQPEAAAPLGGYQPARGADARDESAQPIDAVSLTFAVLWQGHVGATLRLSRANDAAHDPFLSRVLSAARLANLHDVAVGSLGVLRADGPVLDLLAATCRLAYQSGLESCVRTWVLPSPLGLVDAFERLGFRRTGATLAGQTRAHDLHVLQFDLFDVAHLWSIGSPLLATARDFAQTPAVDDIDEAQAPRGRVVISGSPFDRALPRSRVAATIARGIRRFRPRRRVAF